MRRSAEWESRNERKLRCIDCFDCGKEVAAEDRDYHVLFGVMHRDCLQHFSFRCKAVSGNSAVLDRATATAGSSVAFPTLVR